MAIYTGIYIYGFKFINFEKKGSGVEGPDLVYFNNQILNRILALLVSRCLKFVLII